MEHRLDTIELRLTGLTNLFEEEKRQRGVLAQSIDTLCTSVRQLSGLSSDVNDLRKIVRDIDKKMCELSPFVVTCETVEAELSQVVTEHRKIKKELQAVQQSMVNVHHDVNFLTSGLRDVSDLVATETRKFLANVREVESALGRTNVGMSDLDGRVTEFSNVVSRSEDKVNKIESAQRTLGGEFAAVRHQCDNLTTDTERVIKEAQKELEKKVVVLEGKIRQSVTDSVDQHMGQIMTFCSTTSSQIKEHSDIYQNFVNQSESTLRLLTDKLAQLEDDSVQRWKDWGKIEEENQKRREEREDMAYGHREMRWEKWIGDKEQQQMLTFREAALRAGQVLQEIKDMGDEGVRRFLDEYKYKIDRRLEEEDKRRKQIPSSEDKRVEMLVSELSRGSKILDSLVNQSAAGEGSNPRSPVLPLPQMTNNPNPSNNSIPNQNLVTTPHALTSANLNRNLLYNQSPSMAPQQGGLRGSSPMPRDPAPSINVTQNVSQVPPPQSASTQRSDEEYLDLCVERAKQLRDRRRGAEEDIDRIAGVLSTLQTELGKVQESLQTTTGSSPRSQGLHAELLKTKDDMIGKERLLQEHRAGLWKELCDLKDEERNVNDEIRLLSQQMLGRGVPPK